MLLHKNKVGKCNYKKMVILYHQMKHLKRNNWALIKIIDNFINEMLYLEF